MNNTFSFTLAQPCPDMVRVNRMVMLTTVHRFFNRIKCRIQSLNRINPQNHLLIELDRVYADYAVRRHQLR